MKILIGYPPTISEKGTATLGQNRQFQWFNNPSLIFPVVMATAATMLKQKGHKVLWQDCVAASVTSAPFRAANDGFYQFEVRALDNLGFLEAFANQGEAATIVDVEPPFLQPRAWFPIILKQ